MPFIETFLGRGVNIPESARRRSRKEENKSL